MDEQAIQKKFDFILSKRAYQDPDIFKLDDKFKMDNMLQNIKDKPADLLLDNDFKDNIMPTSNLRKQLRTNKHFEEKIQKTIGQLESLKTKEFEKQDTV